MNSSIALHKPRKGQTTAGRGSNFYKNLTLRKLKKYTHGSLLMNMPDGTTHKLGFAGDEPCGEITVKCGDFFKNFVLHGSVGFGDSYVAGDWVTKDIRAVLVWLLQNVACTDGVRASFRHMACGSLFRFFHRIGRTLRPNEFHVSMDRIAEHYDMGNDFYALWLDETMSYSSAKFEYRDQTLDKAQRAKYHAICRKLQLKPGDQVLEIGCGWGGFSSHAATHYGCRVTAVTISKEQYLYAKDRIKSEGLMDRVEILLQDYRSMTGTFDKVVSIETMEAVGDCFAEGFFARCSRLLRPQGLLAVQVMTIPDCRYQDLHKGVNWMQKQGFPGSRLMSVGRMNQVVHQTSDFHLHDLEDLGNSYALTFSAWRDRFREAQDEVRQLGFGERFIRQWYYYFTYCEAALATKGLSVVQAVYTRPNNETLVRLT